ncbi:MAG: CRTAC1 family protein [Thermoanaerobaculia bacterium]
MANKDSQARGRSRVGALVAVTLMTLPVEAGEPRFTEVSAEIGLDFVHFNGMSGELYFVEMMGQGLAVLDYDNDGDLDVYFLQGHMLGEGKSVEDATIPPRYPGPFTDRLYRNDLTLEPYGKLQARFVDVTEQIGLAARGYGIGVASGDYDNDGFTDLYLNNWGSNQMLRNNGDGTFSDATEETGTDDPRYSASSAFLDFDRDGWLDLFVGNYVDWRFVNRGVCSGMGGERDYCAPWVFKPVPDTLFRNRGSGRFENVTRPSGIEREFGAALGVVSSDFDQDGWPDIYVANDASPNQLWMNQQNGTFVNDALLAGCAVNDMGMPEGSMGVVAGDINGDGSYDLFMSHIVQETNTLYLNDGRGLFRETTRDSGLALPSYKYTGFGTALFDFDNDGWLDLFVANGAVHEIEHLAREGDIFPIHQPDTLYQNLGQGRFVEVTDEAGAFVFSEVGRGAVYGDLENDGDPDLLVANNGGPARVYRNEAGNSAHWMGLRLVSPPPHRHLPGARVEAERSDGFKMWRRSGTDGSYASAGDPRVLLGLDDSEGAVRVRIRWPDGRIQEWLGLPADRYVTLTRKGDHK